MVRWVRALFVVVLCCTVTSCDASTITGSGGSVSVTRDDALEEAVRRASSEGTTVRLADLTDFSWSEVHVFSEGATPEEVRAAVEADVLDDRYYDAGNLLVFSVDGEVLRAVSVAPDVLRAEPGTAYGPDTELVPLGSARPAILELREPEADGRATGEP